MRQYRGPVDAVEMALSAEDWATATEIGLERWSRRKDTPGTTADNPYWSPVQRNIHGVMGEMLLCRLLGEGLASVRSKRADGGDPDVLDCEAKLSAWHKADHMDGIEGGYLKVPEISRAGRFVHFTMFDSTMRDRAFFDGWVYRSDALAHPVKYRTYGRWQTPVHSVPYPWLRSPAEFVA